MVNFLRPHIRSDNAPEFTAKAVREWLELVGVKTLFIEPGMRKRVDFLLFYRHVFMSQKAICATLFGAKVQCTDK